MAGLPAPLFVRSVEGRAVRRFGADQSALIGARRIALTKEQRAAHACPIVWDTERITRISPEDRRRFLREYDRSLRDGDLVAATEEQWMAQQAKAQEPEQGSSQTVEGKAETTAKAPPKRRRVQEADQ
jgi:hypothetical protein